MSVLNFTPKSFSLNLAENSPINSNTLNVFAESVANDIATLSDIINTKVVTLLNSLPADFDFTNDSLDSTALYVDSGASATKDHGIFYNTNRPSTIYESFLQILQVLANIENGLKEGAKVGSIDSKVTIATAGSETYSWPYIDKMFEPVLFKLDGSNVVRIGPTELNISVNSSGQLVIGNSGAEINIWGYVWHPVFTFNR